MFRIAAVLVLAPTLAFAAPSEQLQSLIELKLLDYNIRTDVTQLTTSQAVALHLELSSPENDFFGTDFKTRQRLLTILRRNDATNPDLFK